MANATVSYILGSCLERLAEVLEMTKEMKTAHLLQELHQRGVTYQKIATSLGVSWRTVHRWANAETQPIIPVLINDALGRMLAGELAENTAVLA